MRSFMAPLHLRLANELDITDIKALMQRAIRELQKGYLTEAQIDASGHGARPFMAAIIVRAVITGCSIPKQNAPASEPCIAILIM